MGPIITAIAPLPSFYTGRQISGYMWSSTEGREEYAPFRMELTQGRIIQVPKNVSKYKMEIQFGNVVYDLVGMTLEPVNFATFKSALTGNDLRFYPILMHSGKQTIMFIDSINDLFRDTKMVTSIDATDSVVSPMEFIHEIENFVIHNGIDASLYDFRYTNIGRFDKLPEIVQQIQVGEMSEHIGFEQTLEDRYCIPHGAVPYQLEALIYCGAFQRLKNFIPLMRYVPDIEKACFASMSNWMSMKYQLEEANAIPDYVSDTFMSELEDYSFTGQMLQTIYSMPENDFTFRIRTDDRDLRAFYINRYDTRNFFDSKQFRVDDWQVLMDNLITAFQLNGKFRDREMSAHRTWLEDIVITDTISGEVLLYIDLIYWALACADGLINKRNIIELFSLNN